MKQANPAIKAIFFDLWNSLITGSGKETIIDWYNETAGSDKVVYDREKCMIIQEDKPDKFLERFLMTINDSRNLSLLLGVRNKNSPIRKKIIGGFKKRIISDCSHIRWLPGALEVLRALKGEFSVVAVGNIWGYQKPYLQKDLKIEEHFNRSYLSSVFGLTKIGLIKKAAADLGLRPQEILFVGDRYDNDIVPAVELGMRALKINVGGSIDPAQFLDDIRRSAGYDGVKYNLKLQSGLPKKCLFIIPPYYKMFKSHNNRINLGITTLVEDCWQAGISAKVYHADSLGFEEYPTRYQILLNSADFYDRLNCHPVFKEIKYFIEDYKPDAIVITSGDVLNAFTDSGCWQVSLKAARLARKACPASYIVSYGPESQEPMGDFDAVIPQEAEADFIDILKNKPRGLVLSRPVPGGKLDGYPLFKKDRFIQDLSPKGFDITYWRRGCLGKCRFCRVTRTNQGGERFRSLQKFIEDIDYRYHALGLRNFYFVDPNFTSRQDKLALFAAEAKKLFPDISWRAESRFDTLSDGIAANLKKAGCSYLKLGLENALGIDHQADGKKIPLEKAKEKIEILHRHGIKCVVYLMLGGYWYTGYDYEQMYDNSVWLGADGYTVSVMAPYVGTGSGVTKEEWSAWGFTGSHLDARLIDYWKIPIEIVEKFYQLELQKGREDRQERKFIHPAGAVPKRSLCAR